MRLVLLGVIACVALAITACGAQVSTVSGKVSLDGQPIPEGHISFVPEKGGTGGGGPITNGTYSVQAQAGKNRVEITASKKMALPPGQVGMYGEKEEVRQYIPTKYNSKSELEVTVPVSGQKDFDLKSK